MADERNGSGTAGARDGIRTRDPNLTKIVRYPCATRARGDNSRGECRRAVGSGGFEPPKA